MSDSGTILLRFTTALYQFEQGENRREIRGGKAAER